MHVGQRRDAEHQRLRAAGNTGQQAAQHECDQLVVVGAIHTTKKSGQPESDPQLALRLSELSDQVSPWVGIVSVQPRSRGLCWISRTSRVTSSIPALRFRSMKLNTQRTIAQPGGPQAKIKPPMAHKPIGAFTQCCSPKCSITMPPPSALATAMLNGATASAHIMIVGALYLRLYRPRRSLGGNEEADPLNRAIDDRLLGSGTG